VKVKTLHSDGETLYKVMKVSVAGKELITPAKALELSKLPSQPQLDPKVSGVNEIYRTLEVAELKTYMGSNASAAVLERPIKSSLAKAADRGDISVLFLECRSDQASLTDIKSAEVEFLSEEKVLLYALNANPGKVANKRVPGTVSAKDIISFGFGFDVLGQKHTILKGPKEMYEALKKKGAQVRFFDKTIYGYRKAALKAVKTILPPDSSVTADQFQRASSPRALQSVVNMEQQGLESIRLRAIIKDSAVSKYLKGKAALDPVDYRKITVARKEVEKKDAQSRWF